MNGMCFGVCGYEQTVPMEISCCTLVSRHASMTFADMIRFLYIISAGLSLFSPIPPTNAARFMTTSGDVLPMNWATFVWCSRLTSDCPTDFMISSALLIVPFSFR